MRDDTAQRAPAATRPAPSPQDAAAASLWRSAPAHLRQPALDAARAHGLPPALFFSLIKAESAWRVSARSPKGAYGLTQLMPGTASDLGVDPRDPIQNLNGGARYLAAQHRRFSSWPLALAAYNAGPETVVTHHGQPPFPETRAYVRRVLSDAGWAGATVTTPQSDTVASVRSPRPSQQRRPIVWELN